jgi:PhoH-like ATPase
LILRKFLVIDTSVLLYDKESVHSFPGNDVVLPLTVLDELDRHKEKPGLLGENARYVNRYLDSLRTYGRLDKGVTVPDSDQTIRVLTHDHQEIGKGLHLDMNQGDNRIISAALHIKSAGVPGGESKVKIITKDINLRVKCDALGMIAEDYYKDWVDVQDDDYGGTPIIHLTDTDITEIYDSGQILVSDAHKAELYENCFVVCQGTTSSSVLCKYNEGYLKKLHSVDFKKLTSISPRNKEQNFALHALTDPKIKLVCLTGIAGSGKTFLTLMSALEGLYGNGFERIVVTRSIQPVGRDLGFLPGDLQEKMAPWMSPLVDNFRHAFKDMTYFETMIQKGQIDIAPLSYIRGRTFSNCFIIVDEAQNATIHELKTIITRVGENSKVILMGDTDQIDTPYIDKRSNGLSIVIDRLKDSELTAHVHLPKGERSSLATLASRGL